jgi:anti-repressor protein
MMDELVTVVEYKDSRAVNARELHAALKVKRDFSNWIKDRVKKHAFEEGADYSPHLANRSDGLPGKPCTDYLLSLSAAKKLCANE